jgi:tetratricopeptide (TPR) repeat protein
MWSQPAALQQYYPLTGTSFWIDYHLWGFWPLPYHVENVLLHVLAVVLFWRLLRQLQVSGAWLAAAVFALHPIMVESAGWITERKNVLSMVFYLGALLFYGKFNAFGEEIPRRWGNYVLAFFLFLAALLAKTTAFSLPLAILLIGWWKRGQIKWRADVLPTLPFFAFAVSLSLMVSWLEKNHMGAQGPGWNFSFPERCLIAGRALWFYPGKLLWPVNLCYFYPRWQLDSSSFRQWLYPITAAGALFILWLKRDWFGRGPVAAVFFFIGALFPFLGFMNVYFMRHSFVCDHWVYLPSLGLIALAAALVAGMAERLRTPAILYGLAVIALPLLAILTWRQSGMYSDMETLWRTTLARNPNSFMAQHNLGYILLRRGQEDEAMTHFQKALEIQPDLLESYNDLGTIFLDKGQTDKAIAQFQKALNIQPNNPQVYNNLGIALGQKGAMEEAIVQFRKALAIQPDYAEACYNIGIALAAEGKAAEAAGQYRAVIQLEPNYADAHGNLANVLAAQGRLEEAVREYQETIALVPNSAQAHFKYGQALQAQHDDAGAKIEYEQALALEPKHGGANLSLAWLLATCSDGSLRDGNRAVEMARQAEALSGGESPQVLDTLAAAYAEAGRYGEAVATAKRALELSATRNNQPLAEGIQLRLKLYEVNTPYHEKP